MNRLLVYISLFCYSSSYSQLSNDQKIFEEAIEHSKRGNIEDAFSQLQKIEDKSHPVYFTRLGELYLLKGRNDMALEHLTKSLNIFFEKGTQNSEQAASCLNILGILFWNEGKNGQALDYLQQALSIRKLTGNQELIADSYNNIGLINSDNDHEKAEKYYHDALVIYQKLYNTPNQKIAQAYINMGIILRQKNNSLPSIDMFKKALVIWQSIFPDGHPNEAFIHSNIGQSLFKLKLLVDAKIELEKALEIYKKYYGERYPETANTYAIFGDIELSTNNYLQSVEYYQKAIIANSFKFSSTNFAENPDLNDHIKPFSSLTILLKKAEALEAWHYGYSLDLKHIKYSFSALESCDSLVEIIRNTRTNKKDQLALGETAAQVYEDAQRVALRLKESTFKADFYERKAFYFSEKRKASTLLNAIVESEAKDFAKIPKELLDQENDLKSDLSYYNTQLALEENDDKKDMLRNKVFEIRRQYDNFIKNIETEYPDYFNLKHNTNVASIEDIQQALKPNTILLSYHLSSKADKVLLYTISQKKFEVFEMHANTEVERYLRGLRNTIKFDDLNSYSNVAFELKKMLIPGKLLRKYDSFIIITEGNLAKIPFGTLITKKPPEKLQYKDLNYLIKDISLSYNFSATLYSRNQTNYQLTDALLVAPVNFNTSDIGLNNLPGTELEVNNIEKIFSDNNLSVNRLVNQDATELQFKNSNLANYQLIHFATHGVVNEDNPELSKVFLAPDKTNQQDGDLYVSEIYNLELDADLVSLSACETGLGKLSKGEGMIGLSRAFTYAGASNLMVSLWTVSDNSTTELMTNFYREIFNRSNSGSYARPLREAKLKMINSKYASPYYWAPFVIIGK